MAGATRSIEIEAPIQLVYDVIIDYERYPEFIADMEAVEVVRRDGDTVEASFQLNLIKRIHYTLELVGEPPHRVRWSLVTSKLFQTNDGGWELEEIGEGRTRATYSIDVGFGLAVPKAISNRLIGSSLPATLEAFKQRAESLA